MHSYSVGRTTFHYNSDFSGDVQIDTDGIAIKVPAEHLLDFVAQKYCLPRRIEILEGTDSRTLLDGLDLP